jgi:hypothetical protein
MGDPVSGAHPAQTQYQIMGVASLAGRPEAANSANPIRARADSKVRTVALAQQQLRVPAGFGMCALGNPAPIDLTSAVVALPIHIQYVVSIAHRNCLSSLHQHRAIAHCLNQSFRMGCKYDDTGLFGQVCKSIVGLF